MMSHLYTVTTGEGKLAQEHVCRPTLAQASSMESELGLGEK